MFNRVIAAVTIGVFCATIAQPSARAAELLVLSNKGRTVSVVDTATSKILRQADLPSNAQLTTASVNTVEREVWGITKDLRLVVLSFETLAVTSRSEVLDTEAYAERLIYCTDESVYCNLIISRKRAAALNDEGAILQTADLPKASYRSGRPRLAAFGAIVDPEDETTTKLYAIDADEGSLIRLPPNKPNPKWKLVAKLDDRIKAPFAFDTIRESGVTRGYVVLGSTLYALNLLNGRISKPRAIKGLKGAAIGISFYAPLAEQRR